MADLQLVIDEMRPMIEDFVVAIGIQRAAQRFNLDSLLQALSEWISQQTVDHDNFAHLASRVAAFISCYLVDRHSARVVIEDNRVAVLVPLELGIVRAFDPYSLAFAVARQEMPLQDVITNIA